MTSVVVTHSDEDEDDEDDPDVSDELLAAVLDDCIHDLVGNLLYYDRREDEDLSHAAMKRMLRTGAWTADTFIEIFSRQIREQIKTNCETPDDYDEDEDDEDDD